jgi:hypothetical protein
MPHPQTAAKSERRTVWGAQSRHHLVNRVIRVLNDLERSQEERDVDKIERPAMCGPGQILQVILQQGFTRFHMRQGRTCAQSHTKGTEAVPDFAFAVESSLRIKLVRVGPDTRIA